MEMITMATVKLDPSKLLGFRLETSAASLSVKCGVKPGLKAGLKAGNKVGLKSSR